MVMILHNFYMNLIAIFVFFFIYFSNKIKYILKIIINFFLMLLNIVNIKNKSTD